MKFTHYLITRFNVPVESWGTDKAGVATLDDPWFQHRLQLFKTFCIPSVAFQTEPHFQWIIFCDRKTNAHSLQLLEEAIQGIPHTSIRFVAHLEELCTDLKSMVAQSSSPFVITSRLDNDDALGKEFMETLQRHFVEKDKVALNLTGGILFDTKRKILTHLKTDATNSFISLIEKRDSPDVLTVQAFHHTDLPKSVEVIHLREGFHWLKIIHERNVRSRLKGKPIFHLGHAALTSFDKKELAVSFIQTLIYVVKRSWKLLTSG